MLDTQTESRTPRNALQPMGPQTRRYVLAGVLFGAIFPVVGTGIVLAQNGLAWNLRNVLAAHAAFPLLWIIDTAPFFLGLLAGMAGTRQDALEERNRLLQDRERQLTSIKTNLEDRVADRTQEIERGNRQTEVALRLARQVVEIQDLSGLAASAVRMLAREFKDHRADLYVLDDQGTGVTLVASSAPEGVAMESRESVVRVGDNSLVGRVAATGQLSASGAVRSSAEDAPSTGETHERSIALPLIARGKILGVLEITSAMGHTGPEPSQEILQLVADQLGLAIDNARLLAQARAAMDRLQVLSGESSRIAWQDYWQGRALAFQYTPAGIRPVEEGLGLDDPDSLHVPLVIRGESIGSVVLKRGEGEPWNAADRDLAEKAATQVALALENIRLLDETRQRALSEQRLSEISARLSTSIDVDTLLQTAVRELASLPEVSDASVFLSPGTMSGEGKPQ